MMDKVISKRFGLTKSNITDALRNIEAEIERRSRKTGVLNERDGDDDIDWLPGFGWILYIQRHIAQALISKKTSAENRDMLSFYWVETIQFAEMYKEAPSASNGKVDALVAGFSIGSISGTPEMIKEINLQMKGGHERGKQLQATQKEWQVSAAPVIEALVQRHQQENGREYLVGSLITDMQRECSKRGMYVPNSANAVRPLIEELVQKGVISVRRDGRTKKDRIAAS